MCFKYLSLLLLFSAALSAQEEGINVEQYDQVFVDAEPVAEVSNKDSAPYVEEIDSDDELEKMYVQEAEAELASESEDMIDVFEAWTEEDEMAYRTLRDDLAATREKIDLLMRDVFARNPVVAKYAKFNPHAQITYRMPFPQEEMLDEQEA